MRSPSPTARPWTAFVGLGSNLDDGPIGRRDHLRRAVAGLAAAGETLIAASSLYETRPLGPSREPFLNAAVRLHSAREPEELLALLLALEQAAGRRRRERWAARTLDLDLLAGVDALGHAVTRDGATLTLPHPELAHRDFVLQPLVDLAPALRVGDSTVAEQLAALPRDAATILKVAEGPGWAGLPRAAAIA